MRSLGFQPQGGRRSRVGALKGRRSSHTDELAPLRGWKMGGPLHLWLKTTGYELQSLRDRALGGLTPEASLGAYGEKFTKVCRLCGCDVESSEEILHLSLDSVVVRVQGMWILGFAPGLASATSGEQGLDDLVSQNHQTRQRT